MVAPADEWTQVLRKDKPEKYLNTHIFVGAWKQIKAENSYSGFSWTVKVDIPTVFLPGLLNDRLGDYLETPSGTYVETGNKVLMDFSGSLEGVSRTGMKRFLEQESKAALLPEPDGEARHQH